MEPIELMSPEVHELLNKPPGNLTRWGSGIIATLIVTLLLGSYLIHFPETVTALVTVTTEQEPVWLTAKKTSAIQQLFFHHLDSVKKGTIIAIMENTANAEHVMKIEKAVSDSTFYCLDSINQLMPLFNQQRALGELQSSWSTLVSRFLDYYSLVCLSSYQNRQHLYKEDLSLKSLTINTLKQQKQNLYKLYNIQKERFSRDEILWNKGIISDDDYQNAQQLLLTYKESLDEITVSQHTILSDKQHLIQTANDEKQAHQEERTLKKQAYFLTLKEFSASIIAWKQLNMVISPIDGVLNFPENKNLFLPVNAGDNMIAVLPMNAGNLVAKLKIPANGIGKLKIGQTVILYLDGYPYLEYGTLNATINAISVIPDKESTYTAIAELNLPLKTNYGKTLKLSGELTGTAKIKTRDYRFIERLINPLKYLIHTQKDMASI